MPDAIHGWHDKRPLYCLLHTTDDTFEHPYQPLCDMPDIDTTFEELAQRLRQYADEYETSNFLRGDPSLFMHLVEGDENRETTAFVAATLSYGSRRQFMPKIQWLLDASQGDMFGWIKDGGFIDKIPDDGTRFYRLQTMHDIHTLLRALQKLINSHGSIGQYVKTNATDGFTAIRALTVYFRGKVTGGIVPKDTASACKRLCMFTRWMTRDNSPVDIGIWAPFIDKRSLIMPLDTHVLHQACLLGLLKYGSPSMATAKKLTAIMRSIFPDDPLRGDFALFGYDVTTRS